jgi:hypothetical protein
MVAMEREARERKEETQAAQLLTRLVNVERVKTP